MLYEMSESMSSHIESLNDLHERLQRDNYISDSDINKILDISTQDIL